MINAKLFTDHLVVIINIYHSQIVIEPAKTSEVAHIMAMYFQLSHIIT